MQKNITVAITGHRDMVETTELRRKVNNFFKKLIEENPQINIKLLSPLADGADRFVAKIFLEIKKNNDALSLVVPMPFAYGRYKEDFDEASLLEFDELSAEAENVFAVVPKTRSGYLDVGRYVVDESDILLALWDGTYNGKVGGTGEVVEYAKKLGKDVVHYMCERKNG